MKEGRLFVIAGILSVLLLGCGSESHPARPDGRFEAPQAPPALGSRLEVSRDSSLIISEFMAENDSTLQASSGEYSDWIELYNYGATPVDLEGWALTDDPDVRSKWVFPERIIAPGEYLVVFASGVEGGRDGDLSCSFRLSSGGEFLGLVSPEGEWVHRFDPGYPKQRSDLSYGIASDWGVDDMLLDFEGYFLSPTPGQINSDIMLGEVEPVEWSVASGVYRAPLSLALSSRTRDAKIYFTRDGAEPTPDSGLLYDEPISISVDTVLKVRAVKPRFRSSKVGTATFLISDQPNGMPNRPPLLDLSFPIVSLSLEPSDLEQLQQNETLSGRDGEFRASLEWLDLAGSRHWSVESGMRRRRTPSGAVGEAKPSYRLYFRDEYGPSKLEENVFGLGAVSSYDRLDLKPVNSVFEDLWSRFGQTLIGAAHEPFIRGQWCQLYLNGEFHGLYECVERPDLEFAVSYFDGKRSAFDLIGQGGKDGGSEDGAWFHVIEGEADAWLSMLASFEQDSDDREFNAGVSSPLLERDHLIRYVLLTSFSQGGLALAEADWIAIRNRKAASGFRWILRGDVGTRRWDLASWNESMAAPGLGRLWSTLIQNEEFRIRVQDQVHRLLFVDGLLTRESLRDRARRLVETTLPLVRADLERWPSADRENDVANLDALFQGRWVEARRGLLAWLQSLDLVSALGGVEWSLPPRPVPVGASLVLGARDGEIFYTTDGTDPRARGGRPSEGAQRYQDSIQLLEPLVVTCRIRRGAAWGPLEQRAFDVGDGLN